MSLGRTINRLIQPLGLTVGKIPVRHDLSEMQTPAMVDRLRDELAAIAVEQLNAFLPQRAPFTREALRAAVDQFYALYNRRPVEDNSFGSGFQNLFWLFLVGRMFSPKFIVESGVWRGQSSWMFRQACSEAEMHCFDISLEKLAVKDPSIHFHERDWMDRETDAPDPESSLAFFDCHVNQGMRIRQAYDRGFRYLMLDDNVPADTIYFDGTPALPSLDMIMDPEVHDGLVLNWTFNGQPRSFTYSDRETHGVAELIDYWVRLPNIARRCGYPGLSYLSLVRLRAK